MVPILSTLRLPTAVSTVTLAQLIVILTLLPFSFQSKLKDSQLVIYSNGPCLISRFFESEFTDSTPYFPTLRPVEVPLKIAGKNCSQNDPGWITSIDYFMDPVTLDFYLIWADSDSETLWSGRVNSTNYHISDVKQLRDNNSVVIGSRVRSLIVDQSSGKLFISLPSLHRIEMYDLIDGLLVAQRQKNSHPKTRNIVNLNRTVLLNDVDKIGKVLYNRNRDKLFWIESNKCLWSGTPSFQGIQEKKILMCNHPLSDEVIYSAVIDSDSGDIYVFYEKGKIERLSGSDWSRRSTVIKNCLADEKYKDAKFYTIQMMKEKHFLRFFASDTQHYAFRQISLIKRFEAGQNDEGDADEYILDGQNSGILFTDQPNIYDFIFPGTERPNSLKISSSVSDGQNDEKTSDGNQKLPDNTKIVTVSSSLSNENRVTILETVITSTGRNFNHEPTVTSFPSSAKYRSMMKPTLELVNNKPDLPKSKSIKELTPIPADNLDTISPLSKMIVSSSSGASSRIESLPPQITLLTVTSSSTIIYWLYTFLAVGIIILSLWVLFTVIGLKRNYQKVYSDDNSLKENLTNVKY